MKRFRKFTLTLMIIFALSACGGIPSFPVSSPTPEGSAAPETPPPSPVLSTLPPVAPDEIEIALVTGTGGTWDAGIGQNTWDGVTLFAEENGRSFGEYLPAEDSTDAYVSEMTNAIDMGARVVVITGGQFGEALSIMSAEYPDTIFLGLDTGGTELNQAAGENLSTVIFREEEAGFLAGYAAVMDGYGRLGFIGGMANPSIIRYGYGFLQGADAAAAAIDMDVSINYWYSDVLWADDAVYNTAHDWYSGGTELIFAYGGGLSQSVMAAAEASGGDIIGVGGAQTEQGKMFVASALIDHRSAVYRALTDLYDNILEWPADYAGQVKSFGVSEGMVGLSTSEDLWGFQIYTTVDYEVLFNKIVMDTVLVDDCGSNQATPPELVRASVWFANPADE